MQQVLAGRMEDDSESNRDTVFMADLQSSYYMVDFKYNYFLFNKSLFSSIDMTAERSVNKL